MMDEQQLDKLMRLAGVALDNGAARRWLDNTLDAMAPVPAADARGHLKRLQKAAPPEAAIADSTPKPPLNILRERARPPTPSERNAPLDEIKKHAEALLKQFDALREDHPQAHHAFWHAPLRGRQEAKDDAPGVFRVALFATEDDVEPAEESVIRVVEKIIAAAAEARIDRNGRPPDRRKQHAVDWAAAFFVRYSPENISGTPTGKFADFARAFCAAASGRDDLIELDRQIRDAAEKAKAQVGQNPPVLS